MASTRWQACELSRIAKAAPSRRRSPRSAPRTPPPPRPLHPLQGVERRACGAPSDCVAWATWRRRSCGSSPMCSARPRFMNRERYTRFSGLSTTHKSGSRTDHKALMDKGPSRVPSNSTAGQSMLTMRPATYKSSSLACRGLGDGSPAWAAAWRMCSRYSSSQAVFRKPSNSAKAGMLRWCGSCVNQELRSIYIYIHISYVDKYDMVYITHVLVRLELQRSSRRKSNEAAIPFGDLRESHVFHLFRAGLPAALGLQVSARHTPQPLDLHRSRHVCDKSSDEQDFRRVDTLPDSAASQSPAAEAHEDSSAYK